MSPVVVLVCGVMLTIGTTLALLRAERGPSMLDRVVALDVVTAAVLATVALISALQRRSDLLPVLVVLSLVGFIGSVTIARFAATESDEERRMLTREEARALRAEQRAAELAAAEAEHVIGLRRAARDEAAARGEAGARGEDPLGSPVQNQPGDRRERRAPALAPASGTPRRSFLNRLVRKRRPFGDDAHGGGAAQ